MAKKNSKKTVPDLRFRGFTDPWEQRQLGEVAEKTGSGGTPVSSNPRYYGGSIPFLGIGDINGRYVDTTQKTLTEEGVANSAAWIVPEGAISLAMYASYGKSAILARPMATSQAFFNIVFRSNVTRDFVYSRLQCAESRHEWDVLVSTGTQPNLSGSKLKKWTIGYPSLPEQRRIGEFFSTLDSLIAAAERQEALLRQKKQAYLQLMFPREGETQPRLRFAGFSGGWKRRQLREVAVKTGSGGTPTSSNPRYYGGSIPFLGIGDINGRYVDTTQKTLTEEGVANSAAWIVPEGAISLAMYASYGKSAILARPMATSQAFFNIVFRSNVTRDFVYSRLQCAESRHEWDVLVSTGTQPNLSGSKLKKWTIGYPSLPEQHHIGEFFKVLDSLIAAAEERTKALTALKSVYLQRMFV